MQLDPGLVAELGQFCRRAHACGGKALRKVHQRGPWKRNRPSTPIGKGDDVIAEQRPPAPQVLGSQTALASPAGSHEGDHSARRFDCTRVQEQKSLERTHRPQHRVEKKALPVGVAAQSWGAAEQSAVGREVEEGSVSVAHQDVAVGAIQQGVGTPVEHLEQSENSSLLAKG